MEQEKNSYDVFCERMYRVCSVYMKRGFVCSANASDPTGMKFYCRLIAFSDEEFEQWLQELRDGLDRWICSEKGKQTGF